MIPVEPEVKERVEAWVHDVALRGGYLVEELYGGEIRFGMPYMHNGITHAWTLAIMDAVGQDSSLLAELDDTDITEASVFRYADTYRYVQALQAHNGEPWEIPGLEGTRAYWKPRQMFFASEPHDAGLHLLRIEVEGGPAYDEHRDTWATAYVDRLRQRSSKQPRGGRPENPAVWEAAARLYLELKRPGMSDQSTYRAIEPILRKLGLGMWQAASLKRYKPRSDSGLPTADTLDKWWESGLSTALLPNCAVADLSSIRTQENG